MGSNLKLIIVVFMCFVVIGISNNLVQKDYNFSLFDYAGNLLTGGAVAGNDWIGNQSNLNCSVYKNDSVPSGFNEILALYDYTDSHISLPNETHRGEYGLYCKDVNDGGNLTWNNSLGTVFLRALNTSNSHVEMANKTPAEYSVNLSIYHEGGGVVSCSYQNDSYGNCSSETETCLLTVPYEMIGNDTDLHVADCNFTNAYDTSICCELESINVSIYLDGVYLAQGDNISLSGKPSNFTVNTNIITGRVVVREYNGLALATILQYTVSNLSSISEGITQIKSHNTSLTIIPTGGIGEIEEYIGGYYIELQVQNNNNVTLYTQKFNVTNRLTSTVTNSVDVPNKADIGYTRQEMDSVTSRATEWLNAGGGINHNLIVNGTTKIIGNNFNISKGQPTGFNITILDDSQNPVNNAIINISEINGYVLFALPEYTTLNLSSTARGTLISDSFGNVKFGTFPSGGLTGFENNIGDYGFIIEVYNNSGDYINTINIDVNRTLKSVGGSIEDIYNQPSMAYALQNLDSMSEKAKEWINKD